MVLCGRGARSREGKVMAYTVDLASPIGKRWLALGGSGGLGDPISAELGPTTDRWQRFPGGGLTYRVGSQQAWLIDGPIFDHWNTKGKSFRLIKLVGSALGDSYTMPLGGIASEFTNGVIISSGGRGPIEVTNPVYARYALLVNLRTAAAPPAIGMPVEAPDATWSYQRFDHGVIFGTEVISTEALDKWNASNHDAIGRALEDTFSLAFGGEATQFEHGVVISRGPGTPPIVVQPPIYERYAELVDLHAAALPPIGLPVADEDPALVYQEFDGGAIFPSPAFGNVLINPDILRKWRSPQVASRNIETGESLQHYLGRPTADSFRVDRGETAVYFERGLIVARTNERAFEVHGPIYARYRELGDLRTSPPYLGLPTSDEQLTIFNGVPSSAISTFDRGEIHWHHDTGAWDLTGAILQRYLALLGPAGEIGYPIGAEEDVLTEGGKLIGRMVRFAAPERGLKPAGEARIYWNGDTGACFEVTREVLTAWLATGGPRGPLGFPVGPETDMATTIGVWTDFEHGVGAWKWGLPAIAIPGLQVQLTQLHSEEDFNVQVRLSATPTGETNYGRMPAAGEFEAGEHEFAQEALLTVPLVRGATHLAIWLLGISENLIGKDTRLGTIDVHHSVEDLWGLFDPNTKHVASGFDATFQVREFPDTFVFHRLDTPTETFWPFHNFKTPALSWHQYAETFADVSVDDRPHFSWTPHLPQPFKWLFYQLVYRDHAAHGNCFGFCVEAIYALLHRAPFAEPIFSSPYNRYRKDLQTLDPVGRPDDLQVGEALNIKHGYQLGSAAVGYALAMWSDGLFRDPITAFDMSKAFYEAGQYPILSLSSGSALSRQGHVVMPYDWIGDPRDPHRETVAIRIADSRDPGAAREKNISSTIFIETKGNRFWYEHDKDDWWTGSSEEGGRLFAMPFTLFAQQPSLPGVEWGLQFANGVLMIVAGDAETAQVTDDAGRTLYDTRPLGGARHRRPAMGAQLMPGIVEVPLAADWQDQEEAIQLPPDRRVRPAPAERGDFYYLRRKRSGVIDDRIGRWDPTGTDASSVTCHVAMDAAGSYSWGYASGSLSMALDAESVAGAVDVMIIDGLAEPGQSLTLACDPSIATARAFNAAFSGWPTADDMFSPWFRVSGLRLAPGHKLGFTVSDRGRALTIINEGAPVKYDLGLHLGRDQVAAGSRTRIALPAQQVTTIRPTDWAPALVGSAPIRLTFATALHARPIREILI
jgi:uncharacterized protein with LGFP repeats